MRLPYWLRKRRAERDAKKRGLVVFVYGEDEQGNPRSLGITPGQMQTLRRAASRRAATNG